MLAERREVEDCLRDWELSLLGELRDEGYGLERLQSALVLCRQEMDDSPDATERQLAENLIATIARRWRAHAKAALARGALLSTEEADYLLVSFIVLGGVDPNLDASRPVAERLAVHWNNLLPRV